MIELINQILLITAMGFLGIALLFLLLVLCQSTQFLIKLVALEVMVNLFISFVGLWVLRIQIHFILDICIALSLVMFLSTVAYCQFLLKRGALDA